MSGKLHLYLITFNCALIRHDVAILSSYLLSGIESPSVRQPDLIVLSLQEVAPLAVAFSGGPGLATYFEPFSTAIRTATRKRFNEDYALVARSNLGLTGIMVFARYPAHVGNVSYGGVGTGVMELGNKGGVGVKLHYNSVEMNFLAAHLAPDEENVLERNENWAAIVKGVVFEVGKEGGDGSEPPPPVGLYSPTAHLFVLGDLNYRTADSRPIGPEFLVFPQSSDPPSSNTHFLHLLENDQLSPQRKDGKTLHGLEEAPITFPPTYKYQVNNLKSLTAMPTPGLKDDSWNWTPLRWPSWTDRILYLPLPSRQDITVHKYTSIQSIQSSDHRPVVAHISIPSTPIEAGTTATDRWRSSPPYALDLDWKSKRYAARRREIAVGFVMYLLTTWAGRAAIIAVVAGGVGVWWVAKGLLVRG